MQFKDYLTIITLMAVYLGYAGLLGALITLSSGKGKWVAVLFTLVIMMPASLAFPWDYPEKYIIWALGSGVVLLFSARPQVLPAWFWGRRFALGYFGVIMLLIMWWSVVSDHPFLWVWIGLPACCAACLGLQRAFQFRI